jgi:hypothetical protein
VLLISCVLGFHLTIGLLAYRQFREPLLLGLTLAALPLWAWAYVLFGGGQ